MKKANGSMQSFVKVQPVQLPKEENRLLGIGIEIETRFNAESSMSSTLTLSLSATLELMTQLKEVLKNF